ncbi:fasciclin domain-containing protein [Flavobacterium sp. Fl-77]|uniref:Fasciclin domain-containing protein n=1 Tax=Flavobacterium flavipigmentatum TaxID=2893884 RepID=A0AAJ2SFK1_9FLAO|nr:MULTISPECIES: fasciclin domain-containing protein [unclassified Flavobacterium]MDX6181783.1 fasciclin domain-containing protein [Flavobacterium sp. Fl-33]MDX6185183.1 fasciclin domain-containing protein [Flavobacterium sp. Fl-77]UFH37290.1 fasciclin domain-containing protein [Flavobacterium sp. F-70]
MKTIKIKLFALLALCTFLTISCNNDDDNASQEPQTIAAIAKSDPNLSSLVAALKKAELETTLNSSGTYTVFAPTNAAFSAFLTANGYANLDAVPTAALKEVLLNHVLVTKVKSADITTGYVKTLAKGSASTSNTISMYIEKGTAVTINGGKTNGGAVVTTADIEASNGVIHVVDGVIGLPTIVNHAIANKNFTTLVAALTYNPASGFAGVLSGTVSSPFTVFAPTNTAFTSFLTETGYSGLAAIPANVLETTLKYHVVTGANVQSTALTNGQVVTTFASQNFTIGLTGGAKITDASDRVSNIVVVDVQCSNGIIHAIDKVLLPEF